MPYIHISTNRSFSKGEKETLQAGLAERISILHGKTAQQLMVQISADCDMYMTGKETPVCIVEVSLYQTQSFQKKSEFSDSVYQLMQQEFQYPPENVYLKFSEMPVWGAGGVLK